MSSDRLHKAAQYMGISIKAGQWGYGEESEVMRDVSLNAVSVGEYLLITINTMCSNKTQCHGNHEDS